MADPAYPIGDTALTSVFIAKNGQVFRRARIRRDRASVKDYHVGDYGLPGDTLRNAKRRVGGVSCRATIMGLDHLRRTS
ncbi:hypothetical protein HNR21_001008 [Actinomadura cellulosilytica]|uniref:Uncharacterized protein n=1 Tax=Thermomonospora cellulosilytica TaxID=1411118 RepID=A0A7W3MUG9_9ACTN|nr:hypothetical protein [Thermomonospora cellulosilytica]